MRWILCLGGAACAGPATPPPDGTPPRPFVPFVGLAAAPDVTTDRLCAESADPDAAPDPIFIDCALEGASFAAADPEPTDTLVVMAFNVERGVALDAQIAAFASGDLPAPDVLLVSEADRGCSRSGSRNVPWELSEAMGLDYVFAVEFVELPRDAGSGGAIDGQCEHGNFVASRFPLGNVSALRHAENLSWYVPPAERDGTGEPRLGGRVAVIADVQVGDTLLTVASVHFESRPEPIDIQFAQADETALAVATRPAIVGGDTNAGGYILDLGNGSTVDQTSQAFLSRGWRDAHDGLPVEERGTRSGLPIDLIFGADVGFSDPGICTPEVCDPLSDHQAVWTTLAL